MRKQNITRRETDEQAVNMADGNYTNNIASADIFPAVVGPNGAENANQGDLPSLSKIDSVESYEKAKVEYLAALKRIKNGDWRSTMAARTDDLCALIIDYELENGIEA